MITVMKAQLVRIGNSLGVRLPKTLTDQVGLTDEIDLRVENRLFGEMRAGRHRVYLRKTDDARFCV